MNFWSLISSSYKSLKKHKRRTFLSILGIIIGVFTVIIVLSLTEAFRLFVMDEYKKVGSNLMWVSFENKAEINYQFTEEDLALFNKTQFIKFYSPYTATVIDFQKDGNKGSVNVVGTNPNYALIRSLKINGRYINELDIMSKANVCVISDHVRKKYMYKKIDPIGENIQIKGVNFTVVGYLSPPTSNTRTGLDNESEIFIPFLPFKRVFRTSRVDRVFFSVEDERKIDQYKSDIFQLLLGAGHGHLSFHIDSVYDSMKSMSLLFFAVTFFTTLISSIGLIVSGIGIMNVMLMTIAERRWEIGLRKAVGADNRSIFLYFLIESIILCAIGAFIGLLLSFIAITIISFITNLKINLSWLSATISISFCSLVGLFFGIFPSFKASKLEPLECLEQ